jgi:hypothetical protein
MMNGIIFLFYMKYKVEEMYLQHSLQIFLRLFALPSMASYCLIHFDGESGQLARRAVPPVCVGGWSVSPPPKKSKKGAQIAERGPWKAERVKY